MPNLFEKFALLYLQQKKGKTLKKLINNKSDINKPIELLNKFRNDFVPGSSCYETIVSNILQYICLKRQYSMVQKEEYVNFKIMTEKKLSVFNNKPYQLGALYDEINIIIDILCNYNKPSVLEIGVANGYSSAFLYFVLKEIGGMITSIDLPKFSRKPIFPSEIMRTYLAKRGKIKNTGTLGDLIPGGVVPQEKYAGWLVPFSLRQIVPNISLTGDVFNIMQDLPEDFKFDFVVIDAMKDYNGRMKILELVSNHLNPSALCVLDGYWVNSAFDDFCSQYEKQSWTFGRVGVFANTEG